MHDDPRCLLPSVCGGCRRDRSSNLDQLGPRARTARGSTKASVNPETTASVADSHQLCATEDCPRVALDPRCDAPLRSPEGGKFGFIDIGGEPICFECFSLIPNAIIGRPSGMPILFDNISVAAVAVLDSVAAGLDRDAVRTKFWEVTFSLCNGGIVEGMNHALTTHTWRALY